MRQEEDDPVHATTSRPKKIVVKANEPEIESLSGQRLVRVYVTVDRTPLRDNFIPPATVKDELVKQGSYIECNFIA